MKVSRSLVELLRLRVDEIGERAAFRWLQDGEHETATLSFDDLDREARMLATTLAERGEVGDRALLVFAPGLEFITAFFGCLYAGVVAVPVYPPRQERDLSRLFGIVQDAEPKWVLTTSALRKRINRQIQLPLLNRLVWIELDTLDPSRAEMWSTPQIDGNTLAFLQYTSGTTSTPKGVQVHHRHLLHNEAMIQQAFGQTQESLVVSWLPLYHDMGLIGGVLQPLYLGASCVLMSPAGFLRRPSRWLKAISRYRATTSGGPNFAYDLCTDRISESELEELDLSSWRVAFNGAEPIRARTLDRFADRFGAHGFSRRAFYPCYGLAEATLFVSGGAPYQGPVLRDYDPEALEHGRAQPAGEAPSRSLVGCGRSWMEQRVLTVDPQTREPLVEGVIGEVWVAGPSVAGGYWRREESSRETFEARLANGEGPFLRTGDLGFLDDGDVFIAGRLKDLIILRGRNLYPQDIEQTVETSARGLRLGCSAAFSVDVAGAERLVVVQEVDLKKRQDGAAMLAAVRGAVADVHQASLHELVLVPPHAVPKTSSGKIQRRRCRKLYLDGKLPIEEVLGGLDAAPEGAPGADEPSEFDALTADQLRDQPTEHLAEQLSGFLQSLGKRHLGSPMSASMSYLQQGMDSLRAVSLQHEIETALEIAVPISRLLEGLSIEQLAAALLADLEGLLGERRPDDGTIRRQGEAVGEHPTSFGQQALLALEHRSPENAALHVSAAVRLVGVDPEWLQRALLDLVARHPALRTAFRFETTEPQQIVGAEARFDGSGPDFLEDASALSESELAARLAAEAHRPFNLASGPLMRCRLFRRADGKHVLLWIVHHSVCDLWSWSVMVRDLGRLYRDSASAMNAGTENSVHLRDHDRLEDPATGPLRYTDHVRWQRPWLESAEGQTLEAFWRKALKNLPDALAMPTDRPHPPLQSFRGEKLVRVADRDLLEALESVAEARGTTLFTVLMAAYQALLWRYTGQNRLVVGSPMAGRRRPEVSEVVGYFVNLVPIVGDLRGRPSFDTLLECTQANLLAALEHQDYPLPLMVERLTPPNRDLSRPPIFQTALVLQSAVAGDSSLGAFALGLPGVSLDLGGLRVESMALEQHGSQFELTLTATEVPQGLALSLLYASDLFDAVRMQRFLDHFENLLRGVLAEPSRPLSEVPLLSPAEETQLSKWGAWDRVEASGLGPTPGLTLEQIFAIQARQRPDAIAVVDADGLMTYRALDRHSDRLAARLRARGVGIEDRVALIIERTSRMIVGLLAILKAGGAYVPLGPRDPEQRLRFTLQDSAPKIVLTDEPSSAALPWLAEVVDVEHIDSLPGSMPVNEEVSAHDDVPASATAERAAYLIYTSGSTGRPKGVVVEHGNVQRLFAASRAFALGPEDVWTLFHAVTFDFSVWEIWGALLHGGRLVVVPHGVSRSPGEFHDLLRRERVTILSQTPTAFRQLVQADAKRPVAQHLRQVVFGGEALDLAALAPWMERYGAETPRLVNMYGITETTVHVTERPILPEDLPRSAAPLGPPLDGWSVQLLDARLQTVPTGVPGEICVGGAGLARGYHGRPALTAERFVPNPHSKAPGSRLYCSGDLAAFDFGGEWVHLGRLDHQVKIRGFRIELGEIESALQQHAAVRDAVVLARRAAHGGDRLVAYWTARGEAEDSSARLRRALEERLPDYMVPSAFVRLEDLPLTANGKLDRHALPAPEAFQPDVAAPYRAPRNAAEKALAEVWSEVLGIPRVGIDDPYFALGGDSIRSIRVQALMRQRGYALDFEDLYRLPTISELATCLERVESDVRPDTPAPFSLVAEKDRPLLPAALEDAFPLTNVQSGLVYQSETHPDYEIYLTSLHLRAPLRPDLLARALIDLAARHPILRTSFELARFSQPLQLVWTKLSAPLEIVDLRALKDAEQQATIDAWLQAERRRVFAWDRAPLIRLTVHRRRDEASEERFQLTLSEPFFDGWSVGTFLTELIERYLDLYRAVSRGDQVEDTSSLASSYRQFVALEQATVASPDTQAFWEGVLEDATPTRVPSWQFSGPPGAWPSGDARVKRHAVPIAEPLSDGLLALAHRLEVPIKNVLLAAHLKTLSLLTGQQDLLTGLLENGRPETLDGERLLGLFLNAVCVRQRLHGQSLGDLAR
ncbi:MAG: amino acid adenylation domain-containing protein, partial [Acidobacteriota bacterium]